MGAAALAACGGSSSGSMPVTNVSGTQTSTTGANCANCGTAMVTLTDAPGDFVSYIVTVDSLQLTRADGTVVETVPVATQVDFAQLVNLSEIISAGQIPAGTYVSASITLDYSNATVVVDNGSNVGVPIAASNIINGATSLPLSAPNPTQITLTLDLGTHNQLIVTPGTIANLALDFNLASSNTITPSTTAPTTVTVDPVLTASLVPDATKQIAVRGPLVSANTTASSYLIGVRPFYNSSGSSGQFTVETEASTTYTINGTSYTGAAGLAQLATLPAGTITVADGTWDKTSQTFTASSVLAGSSVVGVMHDGVSGTVLSRTGDVIVVGNGLLCRVSPLGIAYARQVSVTLGTGTTVTEAGQSGSFTIQDISVGQQLQVLGSLSTSSATPTLDATAGSVQLDPTNLVGTVTSNASTLVTLSLESLGGQAPANLNFAGTGTSSSQDATAAAYTVSIPSTLSATGLGSGEPVQFRGFVAPFGEAPPDFTASTLVSYADTPAALRVHWASPGTTAPFATLTSTELLIGQAMLQASANHVIRVGAATLDPSTLSAGLQLDPDPSATNPQFAIAHLKSRSIETFASFNALTTALTTELNGTNGVTQVDAEGPYDATTGVLSVDEMIVGFDD
jgi:hypothetical protein